MAYNYEYPYTDPYRHNDDWLLKTTKETRKRMDDLEKKEAEFEQDINNQWLQFKENTLNDLEAWKNSTKQGLQQDLSQWEAATSSRLESSITTWENNVVNDLNTWKAGAINDLELWKNATLQQWQASYDAFTTSINSQFTTFKNSITKDFGDLQAAFNQVQNDITVFQNNINSQMTTLRNDITAFESDINAKIAEQNAKLNTMQTTINAIPEQIRSELEPALQDYINNLMPDYDFKKMVVESRYGVLGELYQRPIDIYLCNGGQVPVFEVKQQYIRAFANLSPTINVYGIMEINPNIADNAAAIFIYASAGNVEADISVKNYIDRYDTLIASYPKGTFSIVTGVLDSFINSSKLQTMYSLSLKANYRGYALTNISYDAIEMNLDFIKNTISYNSSNFSVNKIANSVSILTPGFMRMSGEIEQHVSRPFDFFADMATKIQKAIGVVQNICIVILSTVSTQKIYFILRGAIKPQGDLSTDPTNYTFYDIYLT